MSVDIKIKYKLFVVSSVWQDTKYCLLWALYADGLSILVKTNFKGHCEGCRCGGNETSRNTILVGSNNKMITRRGNSFQMLYLFYGQIRR